MFLILFVLHDNDNLDRILLAWEETGVKGITIIPSTGLGRIRTSALREDLPLIPRLEDLLCHTENLNRTIFTIVEDEEIIDKIVSVTEQIVGDLYEPDTGILAVLPLTRVYGIKQRQHLNPKN